MTRLVCWSKRKLFTERKGIRMVEDKKSLTITEVQQLAKNFLLGEYYESKLDFTDCQLIAKGGAQVYLLKGKITMRSRSPMSRFVAPKSANQYKFTIEIDAQQGQIINYEVI
jgi:hypothetical protein